LFSQIGIVSNLLTVKLYHGFLRMQTEKSAFSKIRDCTQYLNAQIG